MTDNNSQKLALNGSFERVAKVAKERAAFNEQMASAETDRLERELDITNADHIALWLEANVIPHDALRLCLNWLAVQIVEAHEAALRQQAQPTPDAMPTNDTPAIGEAVARLLDNQHIIRAWRCFDGGYMVSISNNEYWASSIKDALTKARAALEARGLEIREKGQ